MVFLGLVRPGPGCSTTLLPPSGGRTKHHRQDQGRGEGGEGRQGEGRGGAIPLCRVGNITATVCHELTSSVTSSLCVCPMKKGSDVISVRLVM